MKGLQDSASILGLGRRGAVVERLTRDRDIAGSTLLAAG